MSSFRAIKRRRREMEAGKVSRAAIGRAYDQLELAREESPVEADYSDWVTELATSSMGVSASRVLEVGVGQGGVFRRMRKHYPETDLWGIDVSRSHVERCSIWGRTVVSAAEALPFATHTFDGVVCNNVIEHLLDEQAGLNEMARVLRPGGCLVLVTDNTIWQTLMELQNFVVPSRFRYNRFEQPLDDDFTPTRLRRMVRLAGFEIERWGGKGPLPLLIGYAISRIASVENLVLLRGLSKQLWLTARRVSAQ